MFLQDLYTRLAIGSLHVPHATFLRCDLAVPHLAPRVGPILSEGHKSSALTSELIYCNAITVTGKGTCSDLTVFRKAST